MSVKVNFSQAVIDDFCRRRGVKELAIFGSALSDEFGPDSDVDVLIELRDETTWSLFEHIDAEEELTEIFGRKVDLVKKNALRNPFRRHHILNHLEVIYGA